MDGKAIVQSVIKEIVQPGIERLMESRYFSEVRDGKLSIKTLQGGAAPSRLGKKVRARARAQGRRFCRRNPDLRVPDPFRPYHLQHPNRRRPAEPRIGAD